MKLIFRGHDDRYAVEQSLLAFFPEERPVYKPAEEGEDHALVTLSRSPRFNTAVTTITYHGRTARGISRTAVDPQLTEYEAERLRQKAVKLSFFKAAREITGITPSWGALTGIRPGKLASRMLEEGMTERQGERGLRDTYFVSPERRRLCIETAEASRRAKAELKPEDISLYVGIPFCPTRCAYCSFVSQSVERTLGLVEPYLEVLHREITDAARMVQETGLHIKSFYMGGGTPTTLSTDQMDRLLTHLNRSFDLSGCAEYCIEAGRPDTIDREKLQVLLDHGVDRISVNPQSLEDHVLTAIGRRHTARQTIEAFYQAVRAGFDDINMDLIAGLPDDDEEGFADSIRQVLALGPSNITVHTLALKKGAALFSSRAPLPPQEAVAAMLAGAEDALRDNGYEPYYLYRQKYMSGSFENTGWCRPGYTGLYNIYMMEELHTILSLGGGGMNKINLPEEKLARYHNPKIPQDYISRIDTILQQKDEIFSILREIREQNP